mmetsp:Transcript_24784/g.52540  ORF Transcript_24784/g.52540 Transcript_24784/m.52540 type:complete len:118 (+) Transcript_24784:847-1200(+)
MDDVLGRSTVSAPTTVAETRLLREQTTSLAKEIRLLREALPQLRAAIQRRLDEVSSSPTTASGGRMGATYNDILAEQAAGQWGYSQTESVAMLESFGQKIKARRLAGELPLGQVQRQ